MYMIGDVFAVVSALATLVVAAWALLMVLPTLFPARVERAHEVVKQTPWRAFGAGLAVFVVGGFVGLALMNAPQPIIKLLGFALIAFVLGTGAIGSAGIAAFGAGRIRQMDPQVSEFHARSRSSLMLVVAGVLPILGWFVVAPAMAVFGCGAGWYSLRLRKQAPQPDSAGAVS